MADRERYAFRAELEPVVDCGDIVHLMPIDKYYLVEFVEPIPCIEYDFGPMHEGEVKANVELTFLYMPKNELAQWRFIVVDPIKIVGFKQPRYPKWITRDTCGTPYSEFPNVEFGSNLMEWYQFEDIKAFFDIKALQDIPCSRIRFFGFRFHLTETTKPDFRVPTIWYEARAP